VNKKGTSRKKKKDIEEGGGGGEKRTDSSDNGVQIEVSNPYMKDLGRKEKTGR